MPGKGGGPAGTSGVQTPHKPPHSKAAVVLLSASGKLFYQETARRYAQLERVVLICGRYEGVDERVAEHLASEEISIGDFVLSGGELPAALVVDAVTRLLPGALGNEASAIQESFSEASSIQPSAASTQASAIALPYDRGLSGESRVTNCGILDYPHYTRPAEFRGWAVPDVLLGGNHAEIRRWHRKMALAKTLRNRPDLLAGAVLSQDDRRRLEEIQGKA